MDKKCLICEKILILKNKRDFFRKKYCSKNCRSKGSADKNRFIVNKIKNCEKCKNDFHAVFAKQKYCSKKCQVCAASQRWLIKRMDNPEKFVRHISVRKKINPDFVSNLLKKQNGRCALSGIKMTFEVGNGHTNTNLSIDRINSNFGYIESNVQLVCFIVNLMKRNLSQESFINWCKIITENNHAIDLKISA